jgi:SAM-dependent methyltransferase
MNVEEFVASNLPALPSHVLEVGCGDGELARGLVVRGYEITAIDPRAPDGSIFRKVPLEEFAGPGPFDAVVASTSLHHIPDLVAALQKIHHLLRPGGRLILAEFGWEQMDEKTARWCVSHGQLTLEGSEAPSPKDFLDAWIAEHEGLHDSAAMRRALDRYFKMKVFEWTPYIAENHLERPDLIEEERALMASQAINPIAFLYVGTRS